MLNYCSFAEQYGYDETFLVLEHTLSLLVQNGSAKFSMPINLRVESDYVKISSKSD